MQEYSVCFNCTLVVTVKAESIEEAKDIARGIVDGLDSVVTNFMREIDSMKETLPTLYVEDVSKIVDEENSCEILL